MEKIVNALFYNTQIILTIVKEKIILTFVNMVRKILFRTVAIHVKTITTEETGLSQL